jgi:alcohol dehydrogenase (cytochrome c)
VSLPAPNKLGSVVCDVRCCAIAGLLFAPFLFSGESLAGDEALSAQASRNWLSNLGGFQGQRFSDLDGINQENVKHLKVRYSVVLGGLMDAAGNTDATMPVSPLVKDGFLYVVDGWGAVSKIDLAADGRVVWRKDAGQYNLDSWLQSSRGLAIYKDSLISIAADGQLHWLDQGTGEITRSVQVGNPIEGYTIAAPPLVIGDTIVVGGAGADRGASTQIDAIDGRTGDRLWQRRPEAGEGWAGAFLQTGVYDPLSRATIWGTSRPALSLADGDLAQRDTNAIVALDVETGEVRNLFSYPDDEHHALSEASTYLLIPRPEPSGVDLAHFGTDGRFYLFDTENLETRVDAAYLPSDWQSRASATPVSRTEPVAPTTAQSVWPPGCPNIRSASTFSAAYSARTGLAYGAAADGCHPGVRPIVTTSAPGWLGAYYSGVDNALGLLAAVDPADGRVAAQHLFDFPLHAGALATAGGLVFTTTAEGTLYALDDQTLDTLWSSGFGTLTPTPPITFEVGGEQLLAVVVGGNSFNKILSYQPEQMKMNEALFVLVVLGVGAAVE